MIGNVWWFRNGSKFCVLFWLFCAGPSLKSAASAETTMVEEDRRNENKDELTCIHWGYLNVLQLHDVSGKKIKHPRWQTFWTDLCGSTLRLYRDTSLPGSNSDFPPATMIGPRPESQTKYAFFSLQNGSLKDYDATENSPKLTRKLKMGRKHVLQIVLSNFSVYFLQAPTMSAFYRWRTKLQSSMDHAYASETFYDNQLREAKMALYEQQRCHVQPELTYPDAAKKDPENEEKVSSASPPCDPRITALREKLKEKRRLLHQLEKQEKDFLGTNNDKQSTVTRIEFSATAKKDYFLVIGRHDTLIPEGQTFTIFGRLPNGRWRCFLDRADRRGSFKDNDGQDVNSYPLIGSVPASVIVELNQPSRIKDLVDSLSISSYESSPPGTPADDLSTTSSNSFTFDDMPSSKSPRRSSDVLPRSQASRSEPYSNHKCGNTLPAPKGPSSDAEQSSRPSRPTQINPTSNLPLTHRATQPSTSSISPTSPQPESVSGVITDLNRALESLNALTGLNRRSRGSSNVSTCSRTSNSSEEAESSDLSRGSRIELNSDEEGANCTTKSDVVRRRRKRDIYISRKLHAKGISIIVGSSSSSEDEDDFEDVKAKTTDKREVEDTIKSRKIEGLHSSKEKLTEKAIKGAKSSPESTTKLPNGDRSSIDKPTTTTDLLREFSENGCYGDSIRNSVTQAQFKPLASHEIAPPLHQRRTLQMTRKENEGFGFVLQTHTVVQTGAYSDSMTFVSNVSEDGPAYLAGMRPGDVIIEVESLAVDDEDHHMIVDSLKNAGLTIRLVVVYKDAIKRMRLATRMLALKARLGEAEKAYDELSKKERMIIGHVKDPSVRDFKVRMAVVYINIMVASTTFARDTPEIRDSVHQTKRTPTELLKVRPYDAKNCGASTAGFELVREFATTSDPPKEPEPVQKTPLPKYASDNSLNLTKKRNEGSGKQKTFKQCQRSSFVSYVNLNEELPSTAKSSTVPSRRRVKSDGNDPDDMSKLSEECTDELPPLSKTLPAQTRVNRPESYMIALGSQNAINTTSFRDSPKPRFSKNGKDGLV